MILLSRKQAMVLKTRRPFWFKTYCVEKDGQYKFNIPLQAKMVDIMEVWDKSTLFLKEVK